MGTHPGAFWIGASMRANGASGFRECKAEQRCRVRSFLMILNSRTDTFDRKFCGDLASSMASKPVGDHQKTLFGGDIESIFIALTNATDIRDTATIVSLGNDAPAIVARIWQRRNFVTLRSRCNLPAQPPPHRSLR
jgi:hypothetical protein